MRENKVVLVMVVVATLLMFLFLPTFTFHEDGLKGEYHFILNIPADHQINGPLILVEWLGKTGTVRWTQQMRQIMRRRIRVRIQAQSRRKRAPVWTSHRNNPQIFGCQITQNEVNYGPSAWSI